MNDQAAKQPSKAAASLFAEDLKSDIRIIIIKLRYKIAEKT